VLYLVVGLLAIAAATAAAPRLGVAAPLLLVLLGIGVSLLPFAPTVDVEPEWVLTGVLPPLLYAASASMPAMEFRREFTAIRGLSVVLVVISAFALGWFFSLVVPGLGLAWGVALGAVVSPTDAVATSIATRLGVSPRVVTMLEGESLLNDATALVLLRAAVAGTAATVSVWGVVGQFAYAVAVAVVIGAVVGKVVLAVRARVTEATVSTVLSFTVPFLAAVPTEELGASGLVAAVVAGLVTGHGAARALPPRHRLSDESNWRTIELVLEGAVFLAMGLQLSAVVDDVHGGLGTAAWVAAAALALTVLVRAGYVALLLAGLALRGRRSTALRPRLTDMERRMDAGQSPYDGRRARRRTDPRDLLRMRARVRRGLADIEHFLAEPLGWRDGAVVVWAGMRGAITLAAAQTLPEDTPQRSLLVLIAFLVATGSLLLQGGTLPWVVRRLGAARGEQPGTDEERGRLLARMTAAAATVPAPAASEHPEESLTAAERHRLAVLTAQRDALLTARDDGAFSSAALTAVLAVLDADQLAVEMRGAPV
jgi:NhaP-type Na+/H+ or K+/H+ antiporter